MKRSALPLVGGELRPDSKAAPLGDTVSAVDACPSTSVVPSAILFHGCMEFDLGGMQGLGRLMPGMMLVDAASVRYPGLLPILAAMKSEICSGRVGFAGILARLAEVVAAMIVRGWVECGCDNASGLVAALRDPRLARAILALHRQPGRNWTVAQLAAECHVSRSVFAQRFELTIGTPLALRNGVADAPGGSVAGPGKHFHRHRGRPARLLVSGGLQSCFQTLDILPHLGLRPPLVREGGGFLLRYA
jgi:AraC-like DNA-binding protein